MAEYADQIRRRIEIVGLISLFPGQHTIGSFANLFDVDEESLKKDLKALRSTGIDIHQVRKVGIVIDGTPDIAVIEEMLLQYVALSRTDRRNDKLLSKMVKTHGNKFLGWIVLLQRCVEKHEEVRIRYKRENGNHTITVQPLMLFRREGMWRLLAHTEDKLQQFHIAKISSVEPAKNKFKAPKQSMIDDHFRYSWDTWIGTDRTKIKLRLNQRWGELLSARQVVEDQTVTLEGDHYLFEGTVNSLDEVARWVVGRGGEVTALEPEELNMIVCKHAESCLKVHRKSKD